MGVLSAEIKSLKLVTKLLSTTRLENRILRYRSRTLGTAYR